MPGDSAVAPPRNPYPIVLRRQDAGADVTYRNLSDSRYIAVRAPFLRATGTVR